MNHKLLSPEVQKFIKDHQSDDPFMLSLNVKKESDFPFGEAIEQIQSLQKAKGKLPSWIDKENIIWPPPLSIEQSSSEITAKYKARLIHGKSIADLTGGMGVDTFYFAEQFEKVSYVEPNEKLSQIAAHNFNVLGKKSIEINTQSAEDFLELNQKRFDAIFIDPSRRVENKKFFKIEYCSPNLYEIIPKCRAITDQILMKLSPMIDLSLLINDFNPSEIWVVALKGEVKEVLCLIKNEKKPVKIHAVDLLSGEEKTVFEFDANDEASTQSEFSLPLQYIYEPNAAILKSGAFKLIGEKYKLKKLHQHTHLYTSDELVKNFPGKILIIKNQLRLVKKEIKRAAPDNIINVITRNFPLSPSQLKKRFDLKDGGSTFLICTTLIDGKKGILLSERLN